MKPEMYSSLSQAKVIKEAALRSGVSQGVMKACWDAAGEVIKAWATEGHSVALPVMPQGQVTDIAAFESKLFPTLFLFKFCEIPKKNS